MTFLPLLLHYHCQPPDFPLQPLNSHSCLLCELIGRAHLIHQHLHLLECAPLHHRLLTQLRLQALAQSEHRLLEVQALPALVSDCAHLSQQKGFLLLEKF